jgi:hypothetical protein
VRKGLEAHVPKPHAIYRSVLVGLADNYTKASAEIQKAAALPDPSEWKIPDRIETNVATANRTTLGTDVEKWRPALNTLSDALVELDKQGKLATAGDYVPAFDTFSAALRGLK